MKTVIEYGCPVGSFPIPGLHLTNNQAWALIGLANNPSFVKCLPCPDGTHRSEWPALQAGLNALRDALVAAGWNEPAVVTA